MQIEAAGVGPMSRDGPESEDELAERANAGDRAAWSVLVARHERRVLLSLLARGVRLDRARDLTQETWARLLAHQQAGRLPRLELPGLAVKQATYLALDASRRSRRDVPLDDTDELRFLRDPTASIEDRLVARSQLARASAELDRCSATARRVFALTYDDPGASHAETAEKLGLSVQRVRQTICEVRARLRAVVEDERLHLAFSASSSLKLESTDADD